MSRHLDIELTSHTSDGSWTWRAAGARQPRGVLHGDAVPEGAAVGTAYRAEVESGIDGIDIVALHPPRAPSPPSEERAKIEVLGTLRRRSDISVTLADRTRRRGDDVRKSKRETANSRRGADRSRGRDVTASTGRTGGAGVARRERVRRPTVSMAHRNAALATMRPEQLPIAEAILRGGMPAVRQSIRDQDALARAKGRPPAAADTILKMAEELLPIVKLAEWKDRAASTHNAGRDVLLRDLRTVVAASRTVILDDEGRALAKSLREALDAKSAALEAAWVGEITSALDNGRALDALRASAGSPDPGVRLAGELAVRLADAAGAAMTVDVAEEPWMALLDAVVDSPVRRIVKPAGIPSGQNAAAAARNAAGSVPELARMLGLRIPPPPPRKATLRRSVSSSTGGGRAAGS